MSAIDAYNERQRLSNEAWNEKRQEFANKSAFKYHINPYDKEHDGDHRVCYRNRCTKMPHFTMQYETPSVKSNGYFCSARHIADFIEVQMRTDKW